MLYIIKNCICLLNPSQLAHFVFSKILEENKNNLPYVARTSNGDNKGFFSIDII